MDRDEFVSPGRHPGGIALVPEDRNNRVDIEMAVRENISLAALDAIRRVAHPADER